MITTHTASTEHAAVPSPRLCRPSGRVLTAALSPLLAGSDTAHTGLTTPAGGALTSQASHPWAFVS